MSKRRPQRKGDYKELARIVCAYLSKNPCVDCGNTNILVLDFDHVLGGKRGSIGSLLRRVVSKHSLLKEISKCEVRCSNCHRIKTAEQHDSYKWRYQLNTNTHVN